MQDFKINFPLPHYENKINPTDKILVVGSCFAYEMGKHLVENKFDVLLNPFGTLYNPVVMAQVLTQDIDTSDIVENQEVFYHWQAHGDLSSTQKEKLITLIKNRMGAVKNYLKNANWVLLTFGSAFAYFLKSSQKIIANCHKVPSDQFIKKILTINEMESHLQNAFDTLLAINPSLKILITVSPVRYLHDGLVANNRSKARLIETTNNLVAKYPAIQYFPAYEILIDELRDYRFYAQDRVHPSPEAVAYIWKQFSHSCLSKEAQEFIEKWQPILKTLRHKPRHPNTTAYKKHIEATLNKLQTLPDYVDIQDELTLLNKKISLQQKE